MERLDVIKPKELKPNRSANVLFHFMPELRFLCRAIETKALFPRYCKENITYLNLRVNDHQLTEVAYPEKCFCDIPVHNVSEHTKKYGPYGIGLPKTWGIEQGIQPIQYVNINSQLIKDFQTAFQKGTSVTADNRDAQYLSNYLVSYMLYIKPLMGENRNRVTNEMERIYLTDECEWRFVPDLSAKEMDSILFDNDICKKDESQKSIVDKYNEALERLRDTWLIFEYSDIRYITVKTYDERDKLIAFIHDMNNGTDEIGKLRLISKIIVLDDAEEDF